MAPASRCAREGPLPRSRRFVKLRATRRRGRSPLPIQSRDRPARAASRAVRSVACEGAPMRGVPQRLGERSSCKPPVRSRNRAACAPSRGSSRRRGLLRRCGPYERRDIRFQTRRWPTLSSPIWMRCLLWVQRAREAGEPPVCERQKRIRHRREQNHLAGKPVAAVAHLGARRVGAHPSRPAFRSAPCRGDGFSPAGREAHQFPRRSREHP